MSDNKPQQCCDELAACMKQKTQLHRDIDTLMRVANDWQKVAKVIARDWIPVEDLQESYANNVYLHLYDERKEDDR